MKRMKLKVLSLMMAFVIMASALPLGNLSAFATDSILYGDADGNGKVELLDVLLMEKYIGGDAQVSDTIAFEQADVNADGYITGEDVAILKDYLAGNIESLTPDVVEITFNTGDESIAIPKMRVGRGYTVVRDLPKPQSTKGVFSYWEKADGTQFFKDTEILTDDITLTAVYDTIQHTVINSWDSFGLREQPTSLSFELKSSLGSVEAVENALTLTSTDSKGAVELRVSHNGGDIYTVDAPDGFIPGGSYELELGDGVFFKGQEERIRKAVFIIEKAEADSIKYNENLKFLNDQPTGGARSAAGIEYYINGSETPVDVLDTALIDMGDEEALMNGYFFSPDLGYSVGDYVCTYVGEDPRTRDYTLDGENGEDGYDKYKDQSIAYIRITAVEDAGGGRKKYSFSGVGGTELDNVVAVPETIPYPVAALPENIKGQTGTVDMSGYDNDARKALGYTEAAKFALYDIIAFYVGDFTDATSRAVRAANGDTSTQNPFVYAQVTGRSGSNASYKIVTEEDIRDFLQFTVNTTVNPEEMFSDEELKQSLQEQVEQSGYVWDVSDSMLLSALDGQIVQNSVTDAGFSFEEVKEQALTFIHNGNYDDNTGSGDNNNNDNDDNGNEKPNEGGNTGGNTGGNENKPENNNDSGKTNNPENAQQGKTAVTVGKPSVGVIIKKGEDCRYENGVGAELTISMDIIISRQSASMQVISQLIISLSATIEQQLEVGISVDIDDEWVGIILTDLACNVGIDLKSYTAISVCAHIFTNSERVKKAWEDVKYVTDESKFTSPEDKAKAQKINGYLATLNKAAAKIKKSKEYAEQVSEQAQIAFLKNQLSSGLETLKSMEASLGVTDRITSNTDANGNPCETSFDVYESMGVVDASEELEAAMSYEDSSSNRVGMEKLMDKYEEMLNSQSGWVNLFNVKLFEKEIYIKIVAIKLNINFVGKLNVNITIGADLEYETGKRYNFWIDIFDRKSGSSEMDLLDERFAFQFYVMGAISVKIAANISVEIGIISTKIASIGASVEAGPYLKLYGYFFYLYEKVRPAGSSEWKTKTEMQGAMYLEFGLYLSVGFKAQALDNLVSYTPTLFSYELPLLRAGEEVNIYDFRLRTGNIPTLRVVDNNNYSGDGIAMELADAYRSMKTMSMKTGKRDTKVYTENEFPSKFNITFTNDAFSYNSQTGNIEVTPHANSEMEQGKMRIVYKCGKLAFSAYDIDIEVPIYWTNMAESELKTQYRASVSVNGFPMWEKYFYPTDAFDLPDKEYILEKLGYYTQTGRLIYEEFTDSMGYGSMETEGLYITEDTNYDFVMNELEYTLRVTGLQKADGSTYSKDYRALYGKGFDISELIYTGADNAAEHKYTKFDKLTYTDSADKVQTFDTDSVVDIGFADNAGEDRVLEVNAQYLDMARTATFKFVGLEADPITVRFKAGTVPDVSSVRSFVAGSGAYAAIKSIEPRVAKTDYSLTYNVMCGIAEDIVPRYINYHYGDNPGDVRQVMYYLGDQIQDEASPTKDGHDFLYWKDKNGAQFTSDTMPEVNSIDLYPEWQARTITVKLMDGSSQAGSFQVTYGQPFGNSVNLDLGAANKPQRFVGWYTANSGGNQVLSSTVVSEPNQTEITLYARWAAKYEFSAASFTLGDNDHVYDGTAKPFAFTLTSGGGFGDVGKASFRIQYMLEGASEYTDRAPVDANPNTAAAAGKYQVKITRAEDKDHAAVNYTSNACAVTINKADLVFSTPHFTGGKQLAAVANNIFIPVPDEYKGDGAITYKAVNASTNAEYTSNNSVVSVPVAGTYNCYVQIAQGTNYKAAKKNAGDANPAWYSVSSVTCTDPQDLGYTVDFVLKTGSGTNPGTDSNVYGYIDSLRVNAGGGYIRLADTNLDDGDDINDFEKGDLNTCPVLYNRSCSPWELKSCAVHLGNGYDSWELDLSRSKAVVKKGSIKAEAGFEYTGSQTSVVLDNGDTVTVISSNDPFKRNITGWGNFPTGVQNSGNEQLDLNSTEKVVHYNGTVTDQYGTYNAFTMFGAPTVSLHAIDDNGNGLPQYDRFITRLNVYNFRIDTQGLKNYLNSSGGHDFTYLFKVEFKAADGVKSNTLKKEYRYTVMGPDGPEFLSNSQLSLNSAGITLNGAEESVFSLAAAEVEAIRGQEIAVPVYAVNNSGIWGIHAKLSYDTDAFELLGIENGSVFADGGFVKQNDLTNASVKFVATNTALANLSADGAIATLRFKVKANASEEKHTIGLEIIQCVNVAGEVLTPEKADGSITVNHVHDENLTLHEEVPPTCTDTGRKAYYTCSHCTDLISAQDGKTTVTAEELIIEALDHDMGNWTGNGNGTHSRVCQRDNCTYSEDGDCTGGTATCTQKAVCEHCGSEYGEMLPHTYDRITVHDETTLVKPGTCTENAVYKYTCICGEIGSETYNLADSYDPNNHSKDTFTYTANGDGTHAKHHECCGAVADEHEACSGGTAGCMDKAKCEHCGSEYGEIGSRFMRVVLSILVYVLNALNFLTRMIFKS